MKAPTCYCGAPTKLRSSVHGKFYGCTRWPECDGLVGCHPGTEVPLGVPADKATREARRMAHDRFDALWEPMGRDRSRYRSAAYRWLSEELGVLEAHMGEMDRETALRVVELCEDMEPEDLHEWMEEPVL